MVRFRIIVCSAWLIPSLMPLNACSTQTPAPTNRETVLAAAESLDRPQQEMQFQAMSDGVVDSSDYETLFTQFSACLQESGLEVDTPVLNPGDGLTYIYSIRTHSVDGESADQIQSRCEYRYWAPASGLYLSTNVQRLDEPLRVALIECLESRGYAMSGKESTFGDLIGNPETDGFEQHDVALDCVAQHGSRLYPDLPYIAVSP